MNESYKLIDIVIENMKNVGKGEVSLVDGTKATNMLGIYGQNGSGKTTLIQSIEILKKLVSQTDINNYLLDMLSVEKVSSIKATFQINRERIVNYSIKLIKEYNQKQEFITNDATNYNLKIISETISTKELRKNAKEKNLIEFKMNDDGTGQLLPASVFSNSKNNQEMLNLSVIQSLENNSSVIFSRPISRMINSSNNKKMDNLKYIYSEVTAFFDNVFVYTNEMSGIINAQLAIPFLFSTSGEKHSAFGTIGLAADGPSVVPTEAVDILENIIKQINTVLPSIIPGEKLSLKNYGEQIEENGKQGSRIELVSNREDKIFPFRAESDGIKKIVSILSALIYSYNSPKAIVLIDELDSGIFEFLLGELLAVLTDGSKGQIIFTSHNLRPLEILSEKQIIFTTTNAEKRYIRPKNIKSTNNLRDIYIKEIQLGTKEEYSLYNETDSSTIQKSFRKAAKLSNKVKAAVEDAKNE
ncbi:AAA family ATPase [Enterococcus dongliensis]|uniref:AAA family ATPase n=1 Tax=Enterococcus dongliensis TaxID=2559925 RepID=UPI00288F7603|nr:AAA family ATPase [Enterococcus dongliensis]MDT2677795.1 AAA family ATPase [Enterococcus dongliensis]